MKPRSIIVVGVLLLHVLVLWALQSGLVRRSVELIVPAEVLSEFISPPARPELPTVAPRNLPSATPMRQQPRPVEQVAPPASPVVNAPEPSSSAAVMPAAAVPAPVAVAATNAASVLTAPVATPPPPRIALPSSEAAYLNNPKPAYPALSRRLGEQGKVVVHVLIGVDGRAQQAEIRSSSGYDRLDQAALTTVRGWRYTPGTRNGVPEAMWFNVPINFVLE